MNKYYNKLLRILQPDDKKLLVATQKSWINYRNAATQFIELMTAEKYSGGGTIQTNIAHAAITDLVVKHAVEIFN